MFKLNSDQLDRDARRVEKFFSDIKWIISIVGSMFTVLIFLFSFFGFSSISDIKAELRTQVPIEVQNELRRDNELIMDAKRIVRNLTSMEQEYEQFKEWSNALSIVSESGDIASTDGKYAYDRVSIISRSVSPTEQERREAAVLLDALIDLGQKGSIDPNILFNSSVTAQRLKFSVRAAKLATLAYTWRPSTSHRLKMLQHQDDFGISYQFDPSRALLVKHDLTSDEVRSQTWGEILAILAQNPRIEGEQAYSRAQNVAVKNRSSGYFTQLIDVINTAVKSDPEGATSYAYKSLAVLYSWRGNKGWEDDFWAAVEMAAQKLAEESPLSSWYGHTARELLIETRRLGKREKLDAIFERHGLDVDAITAAAKRASKEAARNQSFD